MREEFAKARRLVVKIGSSLLADPDNGQLKADWLWSLVADVADLRAEGKDVMIVSSGAIALGRRRLALKAGPLKLEESQAAASVGQIALAHIYQDMLAERGLVAAQILLTLGDTEQRRRYLNARSTIVGLLKLGAVPVINENDTVATNEIRYGDNDRLAARVASMTSADCLILLSDVDGLYSQPPGRPGAEHIPELRAVTAEVEDMAGDAGNDLSRGGMVTKLEAARIALQSGTHMVITSGQPHHPLRALKDGARCTWFLAEANPVAARKRWIAGALVPKGTIKVDFGAAEALRRGNSLLPAGTVAVEGEFDRGDAVRITCPDGREIGRGLAAYASKEARCILGRRSQEIESILGFRGRSEMIHRDDLVIRRD